MATRKKKPEAFGDKSSRCLISSIDSYSLQRDGTINIYKKSGEYLVFDFDTSYLAKIAFKKLDSYFTVDTPETDACSVCVRKDVKMKNEDHTWCFFCHSRADFSTDPGAKYE